MLDRSTPPNLKDIKSIDFVAPRKFNIGNKIDFFWLQDGAGETFKLDLVFPAGTILSEKLVAKFAADLLLSGTTEKTAARLHEEIDLLGGFVQMDVTAEELVVSMYGLVNHFSTLLKLVWNAINEVVFPEKELSDQLKTSRQRFLIASEKVNVLARQRFMEELLHGTPFGIRTVLTDFDEVSREKLVAFHSDFIKGRLMEVSLIGHIDEKDVDAMIELLSESQQPIVSVPRYSFDKKVITTHEPKENSVQSAIRIGKLLFNRTHKDYMTFSVVNTVLGGYFGSRLMTSLREEKGYTYGVGSGVAQSKQLGYFFISTEVGNHVREEALKLIQHEMQRLQQEEVCEEELDLVRNYMLGQLLKGSDGPFAMMDRFLTVNKFGLDFSYYDRLIHTIKTISPKEIKGIAQKYLSWEDMIVVSVG